MQGLCILNLCRLCPLLPLTTATQSFLCSWPSALTMEEPIGSPLGSPYSQMSHALRQVHFLAMTLPHAKLSNSFSFFIKHKVWPSTSTPSQLSNYIFSYSCTLVFCQSSLLTAQDTHPVVNFVVGHPDRISLRDWGTHSPSCQECSWMMAAM